MRIKIPDLEWLVIQTLTKYGYTNDEIESIKEILLYAQLRGNNQGVVKLIGKGIPKDLSAGEIRIIRETKLSALLDGNFNFGMLVLKKATQIALVKAEEHGFGIVGTNNTCSSTGAIGYYAREIACHGFVGFVFSGSPPTVAAYGSCQPVFGTNPLAIGIPLSSEPIVLDMATSGMTVFGLVEAKTAGIRIPDGLAFDAYGAATNDPGEAMQGALKTFGGPKGSGLSFIIEALTGPLVGASFAGLGKGDWGNLVFAIDPTLFVDREEFEHEMISLVEQVRMGKKLPGVSQIYLPGERENALLKKNMETGEVDLEENLYRQLVAAAEG